jgi:hypothetical protein
MALKRGKTMKKRNLGKRTKKCKMCPCCKCKCRKCCNYKKRTCKRKTNKKMRGGNQIAYYKLNDQNPAPRDFLTSSRIHGCAGGARKTKKMKGGGSRTTFIPQDLVNLKRGLFGGIDDIKSGFLGEDIQASPYPTDDQPIDHSVKGNFTYSPSNIRGIRINAENQVGAL